MSIWIISTFWLFWMRLLWTFTYMFLLDMWVISRGCLSGSSFFFFKLPYSFPEWLHHFTFPQQCVRVPVSPRPRLFLLNYSHPNGCVVIWKVLKLLCIFNSLNSGVKWSWFTPFSPTYETWDIIDSILDLSRLGFLIWNRENTCSWVGGSDNKCVLDPRFPYLQNRKEIGVVRSLK